MRDEIMQVQVRNTVEEHFKKERAVRGKGVKVLSLFFIDRVANYRDYDDQGNARKGKIAQWFEQAYAEFSEKPPFKGLLSHPVEKVHDGYFSQDKKGKLQPKFAPKEPSFEMKVSPEHEEIRSEIVDAMQRFEFRGRIVNKSDRRTLKLNKRVYLDPEFADLLAYLQKETELTRKTLFEILAESGRLAEFPVNPQRFMMETARLINITLNHLVLDGIKYEKIGGEVFEMRLFEEEEIVRYLENLIESEKSVYDCVEFDSEEAYKIKCGKQHFEALGDKITYEVVTSAREN